MFIQGSHACIVVYRESAYNVGLQVAMLPYWADFRISVLARLLHTKLKKSKVK